ncbi:MAG TPA: hypothetical protein VHP14_19615 [Anaerolineales bacterium]|nr:hypothetical protein [Anaerolineales bacterium]
MFNFSIKKNSRIASIFFFVFFLLLACRAVTLAAPSPIAMTVTQENPSSTATFRPVTSTSTPTRTATLEPTLDATIQSAYETAIATLGTKSAVRPRTREQEATLIARFPYELEYSYCSVEGLSPNGRWLTSSCGYGENKVLVVRNREGKKWALKVKDFLSQDVLVGRTDTLQPVFWSADGLYLYFAPSRGSVEDGDRCSSRQGDHYGLFRLNLNWGMWKALIPSAVSFPGYDIEFSPTGQRYATNADGIRITDLKTGDLTEVKVDGVVMDMLWSPDGLHLAYSVARCGEKGIIESAWVYVWGASTSNQPELVRFSHEGFLLTIESWIGSSMLRIREEKQPVPETPGKVYVYDIARGDLMFRGTVTPSP